MLIRNNLLDLLSYELDASPVPYGLFHIASLIIVIVIAIVISIKYKNATSKQSRAIVLIISIILLLFEVYKQLVFSYNKGDWTYQWYAFPFQFCSVPMYVGIITGLIKEGPFQRALYAFLGTFCLFAGLAVMVYPNDVFISTLGISIQTMVHHGGMLILGVFTITSNKALSKVKSIIGSALVFITLIVIAQGLNVVLVDKGINMFFISPYKACHLPILSTIQEKFGFTVFLFTYIFGFIFIAFLILNIAILIKNQGLKIRKKLKLGVENE